MALAEVEGVEAATDELDLLDAPRLEAFLPYRVVRADLFRRRGKREEAIAEYDGAIALGPAAAEAKWLARRREELAVQAGIGTPGSL